MSSYSSLMRPDTESSSQIRAAKLQLHVHNLQLVGYVVVTQILRIRRQTLNSMQNLKMGRFPIVS